MVYKIGQRVRPRYQLTKLVSAGLFASLFAGTLATAFAQSHNVLLQTYPIRQGTHQTKTKINSHSASSPTTTGSAHQIATIKVAPNASLPALAALRTATCTMFPPKNPGLSSALSPQLRKLAQYEQVCNGALISRDSFFVPTPRTTAEAQSQADDVAATLKEYDTFGIKPLVFMEPNTDKGDNIDLNLYGLGTYDSALDAYFAELKTNGITDQMMGMWVALPEGNIPVWSSVDPTTYVTDVTKTIKFQKKYFPKSQSAILLDSESYPSSASWGNGHYVSLLPYVQGIPKGLVDSFGLQGFPWTPPANQAGDKVFDPLIYLRADFAAEAAHFLGVSNVWFNTGTFNRMYTKNPSQTVISSPITRQTMLDGVVSQAKNLQSQGFSVAVHLFAEDKSTTPEAIDWSYWQLSPGNDANTAVFTSFVHVATSAGIPLWLFDSDVH